MEIFNKITQGVENYFSGNDPTLTYSLREDLLSCTPLEEVHSNHLLDLTTSPLQFEVVYEIKADPKKVYEFISNDENLPKWGSGVFSVLRYDSFFLSHRC
jgi:hypothetical protein